MRAAVSVRSRPSKVLAAHSKSDVRRAILTALRWLEAGITSGD